MAHCDLRDERTEETLSVSALTDSLRLLNWSLSDWMDLEDADDVIVATIGLDEREVVEAECGLAVADGLSVGEDDFDFDFEADGKSWSFHTTPFVTGVWVTIIFCLRRDL